MSSAKEGGRGLSLLSEKLFDMLPGVAKIKLVVSTLLSALTVYQHHWYCSIVGVDYQYYCFQTLLCQQVTSFHHISEALLFLQGIIINSTSVQ